MLAVRHQVSACAYDSVVFTFQRKILMRMKIDYQSNGAQKTELVKVVLEYVSFEDWFGRGE